MRTSLKNKKGSNLQCSSLRNHILAPVTSNFISSDHAGVANTKLKQIIFNYPSNINKLKANDIETANK